MDLHARLAVELIGVRVMCVMLDCCSSTSVFALAGAGLAADDLILTLYFTTIYAMASRIPPDDAPAAATATAAAAAPPTATAATPSTAQAAAAAAAESASDHTLPGATAPQPDNLAGQVSGGHGGGPKRVIGVLEGLTAVSLSALICHLGTGLAGALGMPAQVRLLYSLYLLCIPVCLRA